jgi:hypothetical protein
MHKVLFEMLAQINQKYNPNRMYLASLIPVTITFAHL